MIHSIFFPQKLNDTNPYQEELANKLSTLEIKVSGLTHKVFFFLDVALAPRPTILHLHWVHSFLVKSTLAKSVVSSIVFLVQLIILKFLGVRIIWTVHNLKNHDNKFLRIEHFFQVVIAQLCNAIIIHCKTVQNDVSKVLRLSNLKKIYVIPHGNYIDCYPNIVDRRFSRSELSLHNNDVIFLFLGLIRPYKGILELLNAFESVARQYPNSRLLMAGRIWQESQEFQKLLNEKVKRSPSMKLIPEFIPDDRLQVYFNACDVVIFPYRDILTSGAVLLAMSFGKACIAPKIGCIADTLSDTGAFLYDPNLPNGLHHAMHDAVKNRNSLERMGKDNFKTAKTLNWERIARMTSDVYETVLDM